MRITLMQCAELSIEELEHKLGYIEPSLVLFPEYTFDPFYSEIASADSKNQHFSAARVEEFCKIAYAREVEFVVPLVIREGDKFYKRVFYISKEGAKFASQHKLISYDHWDERAFFSAGEFSPLIFEKEGLKFAAIFGFEMHFDFIFAYLNKLAVDVVIAPSFSAFDTASRWLSVGVSRAFCNSMAIIRINSIKEFAIYKPHKCYGSSFVIGADGKVIDALDSRELSYCFSLDKTSIERVRSEWGLREGER